MEIDFDAFESGLISIPLLAVFASGDGWGSSRPSRYRKDRDHQRFGSCPWYHSLCLQLL